MISRPGQSQGLRYKHFCDWLIHPLVKTSLRRRPAQTVKNDAFSHKTNNWRVSKALNLFKSYGDCAEWVDFAYLWSFIGKGLRLQPGQQACFLLPPWMREVLVKWRKFDMSQVQSNSGNSCVRLMLYFCDFWICTKHSWTLHWYWQSFFVHWKVS